jgi:hypothetical protein
MSLYHASAELQFSKPLPALLKTILKGLKSGTDITKAAIFIKEESSNNLNGLSAIGLLEKKVLETDVFLTIEEENEFLRTITLNAECQTPSRKTGGIVQARAGHQIRRYHSLGNPGPVNRSFGLRKTFRFAA